MIEPSAASSYMICGTPRTGSTLFCGLLRSTGVAGRPESYFRQQGEQEWADRWRLPRRPDGSFSFQDYVRAAIAEGSTDNGVFAVRVMWGTLDEMVIKLAEHQPAPADADLDLLTAAFGALRFVHITRDDTLAQAVSWARAEQTRYWQQGDTVSTEPAFDFDQIRTLVQTIEEHNAAWRSWFARFGVQPHQVHYEQLTADPSRVVQNVLAFLGLELPERVTLEPEHQRQADKINADWIARYRQISSHSTD